VKQALGLNGIVLGGAAVVMAVQPALANPTQVTGVQVNPTSSGMDVKLQTQDGANPQVFAVNRGDRWTADITNTELRLPNGGSSFSQSNPAPGISQVTVVPLEGNNVRVTVVGKNTSPVGQVSRPEQGGLVLSVNPAALRSNAATPIPVPAPDRPNAIAQASVPAPIVPPNRSPGPPLPLGAPAPLIPNPSVTIQGGIPGVPPNLPRAFPPPVGDNATSLTNAAPSTIDLGSTERIPRLVLRDAPAREVLSLLARAAGLNIAYIDAANGLPQAQGQQPAAGQPGAANEGPRITLDVENESVQDVFNNVLRISGLEANRENRTIFISTRLPNSARNVIVRSVRLNQVPVTNAVLYLVTMGAESAVTRERQVTSVSAVPVAQLAGGGASAITQSQTTTESRIENQRVTYLDSVPILRGILANGDERTNTITLTGEPRKVEIALAQLTQLDLRRRQVVVNVRVVDVDLQAIDRFSASFSFGVGRNQFINSGGAALLNFGRRTPADSGGLAPSTQFPSGFGSTSALPSNGATTTNFANAFFLQLQAAVTNGNGKILTDPTLVVQEGQTANVNLTQEIVSNFTQTLTSAGNGLSTITTTVEKARAGLILGIKVDRIDDNGFVGLSVAPSVSQPYDSRQVNINGNTNSIQLLAERRLESGQIRLRDGQTLVLSGIIQDQDRVSITKVPILGDIPILGALFRRTERQNQRREVIVLVTPRILDDSDRSTFGYSYTPTPETQQYLNQTNDRPR
jgi:type IV pilus assembly protein PilQ